VNTFSLSARRVGIRPKFVSPDAAVDSIREEITSQSEDPNHFDPGYFGKGYRWHDPVVERMEIAFRHAEEVFVADGRKL
jgi:hypothetical protein